MARIYPQDYPRIQDSKNRFYGHLDDSQLVAHRYKIPADDMKQMIVGAIHSANQKSSRDMMSISAEMTSEELQHSYEVAGKDLFTYFKKYVGDPASSAHQTYQKHYRVVAQEQFHNRMVQKGRMNSGWRYQYLAVGCAQQSGRFKSVSDIGAAEGDFNAVIDFIDDSRRPLSLYVSIKNRRNTMGGQDWPKAISALEQVANNDKNRTGPYCCVFGITMDHGLRNIKREQKTGRTHSDNTEVWLSDFFWPFFANYTYEEIMLLVLDVLLESEHQTNVEIDSAVPNDVIEVFGKACFEANLLNEQGIFDDPHKLVRFFVNKK